MSKRTWRALKKPLAVLALGGTAVGTAVMGLASQASAAAAQSVVTIPNPGMTSLDPSAWAGQILIDQGTVLEGLYGYDQNNHVVPKIAESATSSQGGLVWTFKLRKDARWSNGAPVTAHDFYYAWMRVLDPKNANSAVWASVVSLVKNGWQYHGGAAKASDVGIKVLDDYTIQLTLNQPADPRPFLAIAGSMPLYQKSVEAHPNDWWMPQNFVGNGPYIVKSFTPNGKVVLVRNPKYVGRKGTVNVGNVQEIDIVPAPSVPVEDYIAGKIDVALISNPADYHYVLTHPNLKSQLHTAPEINITYLQYDKSVQPSALDNVKVRQAIAMVINRQPIVDKVLNGMAQAVNVFGPSWWSAAKLEKPIPYNVAKARQLLKEAGYPNGKGIGTLYLYCEAGNQQQLSVAQALQQEIRQALNINFQIVPLPTTQHNNIIWGGLNQGIKPGYNIATGVANWASVNYQDMQAGQCLYFPGSYGFTAQQRQYISQWYFNKYNPAEVQRYGNPDDPKIGVSWNDWKLLDADAKKDIKFLDNFINKLPEPYRTIEKGHGLSLTEQWNTLVNNWKNAKTDADKHNAWVEAFKTLSSYPTGNANVNVGWNEQVWLYQHESKQTLQWVLWKHALDNSLSEADAAKYASQVVNALMSQGYVEPLYLNEAIYLVKPNVGNVQVNPWSWNNFYQLQYLTVK
ncbi:peptide ABC transporter substrate-binding protein [Alicyclobacillus cellulosilyticus]|uniref:Peptide ABC transporter substrate-binding protein n=1 Tax=Alicyclobacillus cellulosilyticus TaxID=1003997 RepID=A0A917NG26_9BACL|nr:peptide ABC transporter substrate-binding protein [Alicyclobacillus cellulosilyticus]GGI98459.1 peptide ABC transporter substrate-binding protein [Alicyclobacillus cellulosilyticus]